MKIDKSMVGRKVVVNDHNSSQYWLEILFVGDQSFFWRRDDGYEGNSRNDNWDWQFYEEPKICSSIEEAEFDIPMGACKKCGFPLLKHERIKFEKKKVKMALAAIKSTQNPRWFVSDRFFKSEAEAGSHYGSGLQKVEIIWPYGEVVEVGE